MKQQSFEILKRGFEFGTTDLDKETESLKIAELQNFIKEKNKSKSIIA